MQCQLKGMNCHGSAVSRITLPPLQRTRSTFTNWRLAGLPDRQQLQTEAALTWYDLEATLPKAFFKPSAKSLGSTWPPGETATSSDQLSSHKKTPPQMFSSAKCVIIYSNPHSRDTAGEKGLQLSCPTAGGTVLREPWKDAKTQG